MSTNSICLSGVLYWGVFFVATLQWWPWDEIFCHQLAGSLDQPHLRPFFSQIVQDALGKLIGIPSDIQNVTWMPSVFHMSAFKKKKHFFICFNPILRLICHIMVWFLLWYWLLETCVFPNIVQSINFSTNRPRSKCRNVSGMMDPQSQNFTVVG